MNLHWLFTSSKRRARCARGSGTKNNLLAHLRGRTLRLEAAEPRLLLSHTAPQLNPSDTAFFTSLAENAAIGSNSGETVSAMLATGGPIVDNQPLGNNFLSLDTTDGGQEGIAITGLTGASNGAWEYSTNNGQSWSMLDPTITAADAERLSAASLVRFLPNEGFTGTVGITFAAWDQTDGGTPGTSVDLTATGATGGGTAYSTATATGSLDVLPRLATIDPPGVVNSIAGSVVAQSGTRAQQNLFQVAPNGLVQQDTYFDSTHTDNGWSTIDTATTFNPGAELTAYSDGNSTNVFGVDQAGQAVWNQYTGDGGWTGFVPLNSLIQGADAIFASGAPLSLTAESGTLRLFAVDNGTDIVEYSYASGGGNWTAAVLSSYPTFTSATPLAVWDTGSIANIFAVNSDASIETINYNYANGSGSWAGVPNVGLSGPSPLAVAESGTNIDLFGVTSAGDVDHISSSNDSNWYWSINSPGSDVYGSHAALGVQEDASGDFQLFGVDSGGAIKNDHDASGTWSSQTLGGSPAFQATAGAALYADASGDFQVFAPTASGDLAVEEYNKAQNTWNEYALGRSLAPTALVNSIPGAQIAQAGNLSEQDLFEAGADGLVREDRYFLGTANDTGMHVIDSNTKFPTSTTPMLAAYSDGVSTNVFGVANNGALEWAQYTADRGWTGFVPLDSFIPGASATFAAGAPLVAMADNGVLRLFAVGTDNYLKQYNYTASTQSWSFSNLSFVSTVPSAAPLTAWDSGSGIDFFVPETNGSVEMLHNNPGHGWSWYNESNIGLSGQIPLAVAESGSDTDLFAVNSSGTVDHIWTTGSSWSWATINVGSDTYPNNSRLGVEEYASGKFYIYGIDNNGQIKFLASNGSGGYSSQALGGSPAFNTLSGVSLYSDPSGINQIFAPTKSGDLAVLNYTTSNGSWGEHPLGRAMSANGLVNSISGTQTAEAGNLTSQDVFFVGSGGYVQEDVYSYDNQSNSGLSTIDTNSSFNAGTNLTVYNDGTTTNVFAVGRYGNLDWAQYTPGRGWTGFTQLNGFVFSSSASFGAGAPISAVVQNGQLDLFGVGTDGYVREYIYTASTNTWTLANLSNLPTFQVGSSLAVWANGTSIDVFGVGASGAIEWLHEPGGSWTASDAYTDTSLAEGTALAIWEANDKIDLFGVKTSGDYPDQLEYNGSGSWTTTSIGAGSASYASTVLLDVKQDSAGEFSLYGVNTLNQIKNQYYVNGSGWQSQYLGGSPAFSMASTSVGTALYVDPSGVIEVFGQTTSGGLALVENTENNQSSFSEKQLA